MVLTAIGELAQAALFPLFKMALPKFSSSLVALLIEIFWHVVPSFFEGHIAMACWICEDVVYWTFTK